MMRLMKILQLFMKKKVPIVGFQDDAQKFLGKNIKAQIMKN